MKKEIRRKLASAIRAGRVGFDHPRAAEMLTSIKPGRARRAKGEFEYVEVSPIRPYHGSTHSHSGGVHFKWGMKGVGFGEASIVMKDGKWKADTETMGAKFLTDMLARWVTQMEIG